MYTGVNVQKRLLENLVFRYVTSIILKAVYYKLKNKLLFVNPSLKSGGGNRVFIELSNLLTERVESVSILYPNNSKDKSHYYINENVTLLPVGELSTSIFKKIINVFLSIKEIKKILDQDSKMISIISDPILSIFYMALPKKYKKRTYRFVQADDYRIYDDLYILKNKIILSAYKKLCLKSYSDVNHLLFNSVYTYNQFKSLVPKSNISLKLVHPGINTSVFYNRKTRINNQFNICLVARKHPWKGFIDFVSAWNSIDQSVKEQINNIFVISHDNLADFTLPDKAKIIKPSSDIEISEVMNLAQIFISTSWWEGFGLPPLEAMACGCAVLCSNSKGILEYAVDGQNCMIYEPKHVGQLANNLTQLISNEPLRNRLASAAEIDAQQFTWQNSASQFSAILNQNS